MSDTQVSALDHTVQQTNLWLRRLVEEHHLGDRPHAYAALRVMLHALRDRLTPEQAAHLGAQLPLLVRGVYYEGWRPAGKPETDRRLDEFVAKIEERLPPAYPYDPITISKAVFALLWREIDPGENAKVIASLPKALRDLWPEAARHAA